MNSASLEAAVRAGLDAITVAGSDAGLWTLLDDRAVVIDEDTPFLLDKDAFREHRSFHRSGVWANQRLVLREARFDVFGATGVVSAAFTLRGKPTDAGFRLRHGLMTAICAWQEGQWRALALNFGPLSGHITDASPA